MALFCSRRASPCSPEKTAQEFRSDGFFITGDLGKIDADGYLHIIGRAKDMIISGGFNVYPSEVEAEIDAIAGVIESAVIGLPHEDFGEAVAAIVVPARVGDAAGSSHRPAPFRHEAVSAPQSINSGFVPNSVKKLLSERSSAVAGIASHHNDDDGANVGHDHDRK